MEFPEEVSLLEAGMIPHADVLKVGNHGNGDATSEELIKAVSPSLAVISTNTEDRLHDGLCIATLPSATDEQPQLCCI